MFHEQLRADFNFKIGSLENFVSLKLLANRLTKSRVFLTKKKDPNYQMRICLNIRAVVTKILHVLKVILANLTFTLYFISIF